MYERKIVQIRPVYESLYYSNGSGCSKTRTFVDCEKCMNEKR